MTPEQFARQVVIPTVREFRDDRRSPHRAYLACIVTFHLKDYIERYLVRLGGDAKEATDIVEGAMKVFASMSFEIVRAVCHGTKHCGWNVKRQEHIQFVPGQEYERPPCVADVAVVGLSILGDAFGGLEIESHRGGFDLYNSVKVVLREFQIWFSPYLDEIEFSSC